jgi:hypothetical protein
MSTGTAHLYDTSVQAQGGSTGDIAAIEENQNAYFVAFSSILHGYSTAGHSFAIELHDSAIARTTGSEVSVGGGAASSNYAVAVNDSAGIAVLDGILTASTNGVTAELAVINGASASIIIRGVTGTQLEAPSLTNGGLATCIASYTGDFTATCN